MVIKIDGAAMAEKIKDEIARQIHAQQPERPNLAIILVGDRPDSHLYVSLKEKEGRKVGIDTHLYKMSADTTEAELLAVINFLNHDPVVDGILVQLPLPSGFDTDKIIDALDPAKDVDGFHPRCPDYLSSPVLAAISACLQEVNFEVAGRKACLLYNSEVFGASLKALMNKLGLEITEDTKKADLLISALGVAKKIKGQDIKAGAVLIDIGTSTQDGHLAGDIDWASIADKAAFATPVPGGIGPLTIAFLFKNVYEIYRRKKNG